MHQLGWGIASVFAFCMPKQAMHGKGADLQDQRCHTLNAVFTIASVEWTVLPYLLKLGLTSTGLLGSAASTEVAQCSNSRHNALTLVCVLVLHLCITQCCDIDM